MKKSVHAKRMDRHHRRGKTTSKLNLVSLMDIFTILVFFLLVNSSDVEVLQNDKSIQLPDSIAEQKPQETLIVLVSKENILVGSREVALLSDVMVSKNSEIAGLKKELEYLASRKPYKDDEAAALGRNVNIMADKDTPYALLKRVMTTCAKSDYRNISLAVSQVENTAEPMALTDDVVGG